MYIDLSDPVERGLYLAHPEEFRRLCLGLSRRRRPQYVFVDEAPAVPLPAIPWFCL